MRALSILRSQEGLARLQYEFSSDDKRQTEDRVNRALYFCFNKANRELLRKKRGVKTGGVIYEARNQPDPEDQSPTIGEQKRPDFLWLYFFDPVSLNEWQGNRNFCIECKRLGKRISSGSLNEKYVRNGIRRFITKDHEYGKGESSGAMVGYIENMEFDDILKEVNIAIDSNTEPIPQLSKSKEGWQEKSTSHLTHQLDRPFPISPFSLHHLWIDLRNCYSTAM